MDRKEIVDLVKEFSDSLEETRNDLDILKNLAETEVQNIFRGGGGLNFYLFNFVIYLPSYLSEVVFGNANLKIYGVEFKNGVIDIWCEIDPLKRFKHVIDLNKEKLRLWEYLVLLMILEKREVQEIIKEQLGEINIINTNLSRILQFLTR